MEGNTNVYSASHLLCTRAQKLSLSQLGEKHQPKGLKDFATFGFARLQNTTPMTTALNIFRSLCAVLMGKHKTNVVMIHLNTLQDLIKKCNIPDMEETEMLQDSPLAQEEDDE